jgi:hypothetical protein
MVNHISTKTLELTAHQAKIVPAIHIRIKRLSVSGNTITLKQLALFPARITTFLYLNQSRMMKIGLMAMVFITALYTKKYTGEYQQIIQYHIGGIFYVLFGSLVISLAFPKVKMFLPVIMATGMTCMLEWIQWFQFPFMTGLTRMKVFAYIFGTSYDTADFIYYGIGAALAFIVLWIIREN